MENGAGRKKREGMESRVEKSDALDHTLFLFRPLHSHKVPSQPFEPRSDLSSRSKASKEQNLER